MRKVKQKIKGKLTGKRPFKNASIKGGKARVLRVLKEKAGVEDPVIPTIEDKFADDDTRLNADNVEVVQPADWDVQDELEQMGGFKDYLDESRGNTLSYGDY